MAQQVPPNPQLQFYGVYTAGNPIRRPSGTAAMCRDFRIMPGFWPRLRGGTKFRTALSSIGEVQQLKDLPWAGIQIAQVKRTSPSSVKWEYLTLPATFGGYTWYPNTESISLAYDSAWAASNPAAIANLRDYVAMHNGLGVRGAESKPPFSTNAGRYFGLDAFCPGGVNPTVSWAGGSGNNQVLTSVDIWVGLYNSATAHYSNAVYAGTIAKQTGNGEITVSNLGRLTYATHGATETAELFRVFYATIDGGEIPYLILNTGLTGPYAVPVSATSASLSLVSGTTNGWDLDETKEAPYENFPPRPMKSICYVNDRLYGVLMDGGSGSAVPQTKTTLPDNSPTLDFTYIPEHSELPSVVWSYAAGDVSDRQLLGDPLQCWPASNIAFTPSHEQPMVVAPAPDGVRVLALTKTCAFLLEEMADGLHKYTRVSRHHGIAVISTMCDTPYGTCWVTQRGQIVCLTPSGSLQILSQNYQSLMTGTPRCATYLLDAPNDLDRYEVFLSDNTSVIHDFSLPALPDPDGGISSSVPGQGYKSSGRDFTAANTAVDLLGRQHHILAKNGIWTQEAQYEDGLILTTDEAATGVESEINGEYRTNWADFGDSDRRKDIPQVDVIGDCELSSALGGVPTSIEWYADFEEVNAEKAKSLTLEKMPQSESNSAYMAKVEEGSRFWYKFAIKVFGHSTDGSSAYVKHSDVATEGDLAHNFYGSILRFLIHLGRGDNR